MTRPLPLELARAGYEAYGDWADWTNYAGNPMPSWAELPEPQQLAWVAATEAITRALLTPPDRRT